MGNEEFASPQWYRMVVTNSTPRLRPPHCVQLSQDDEVNAIQVTLPSSDIVPGD